MPLNHYGERKLAAVRAPFSATPEGITLIDAMVYAHGTDEKPAGVILVFESEAFNTVLAGLVLPEISLEQLSAPAPESTTAAETAADSDAGTKAEK